MDTLDSLRSRLQKLNDLPAPQNAQSVLYIMSRDCRVEANHALLAAQQHALKQRLPLVVAFVVYDKQLGKRAREHVQFLLDGLTDVAAALKKLDISFVVRSGAAGEQWQQLVRDVQPAAVYFDFSPLRHAVQSKHDFAGSASMPVYVVDTHNVVPVWVASDKQEIGARTLRPKIHRQLATYLDDSLAVERHPHAMQQSISSEPLVALTTRITALYPSNGTDVSRFAAGETAAQQALDDFVQDRLRGYAEHRNDPSKDQLSELSPYLHFGQLASLRVAQAAQDAVEKGQAAQADADTLLEEMIVRKELSDNYCYHNPHYDNLQGAPEWAQNTLAKHTSDERAFTYTLAQFEQAQTHDEAWNAAQRQLTRSGKIHGYMRMYWAKKVLEWSASPEEALQTLLYLNDFYSIDGGDPNGYVGVLWSVAGLHDRPWGERAVYGTIRSMVYNGLKRKFDITAYIQQWS